MAREPEKSSRDAKQRTDDERESSGAARGGAAKRSASAEGEMSDEASASGGTREGASKSIAEFQEASDRELRQILAKRSADGADVRAIVKTFATTWLPRHATESEFLVPALEEAGVEDDKLAAFAIRTDIVNLLLTNLIATGARDAARARLDALSDALEAHIVASAALRGDLSEKPGETATALGSEFSARYERMKRRFVDLDEAVGEALDMLAPRRLSGSSTSQRSRKGNPMARYSDMRERDQQGRFLPEDERDYGRGRYRGGPERDEFGRFADEGGRRFDSRYEDDDNGYRRPMTRSRYDDERYGPRGHGGWSGDPEGHSEASRRGWRSGEHGESGWFGDREGHSEASRRGWRSGEHGESGWFGDPQGHSEAPRRGWEGGHEGYSRARSRYEEDDRRYGGRRPDYEEYEPRRGHGGWSGDSEGRPEASRRGWEYRR